jgi:GAF domain-containing protein
VNNIEESYCRSICEAAAALSSTRSPDALFRNLAERVAKTIGAKGCALILFSADKKRLFHIVAYGLSEHHIKKGPVLADQCISEVLQGKVVAVSNVTEDVRVQHREEAIREGIASILSVPMTLRTRIIGIVRVYTAEPYQFTDDDRYLARAVANLAAVALENARWYRSLKQENTRIKKELLDITNLINS